MEKMMTEWDVDCAMILLFMYFPKIGEMVERNEKTETVMAMIESLSCLDCENLRRGLCKSRGRVGFEILDCVFGRNVEKPITIH